MACLARLRDDTKFLETTFPRSHRRFQILSATVDEVSCRFIIGGTGGSDRAGSEPAVEAVVFTANFSESYPQTAPIWFTESEISPIAAILEKLSETSKGNYNICKQTRLLITELCHEYRQQLPDEVQRLDEYLLGKNDQMEVDSSDEDPDEFHYEMELTEQSELQVKEESDGIDTEHLMTLEKLKQSQRLEFERGSVSGSVQATDRLMKELRDIYRSSSFKNGIYSVDLVNDSLYDWNVKMFKVDTDSALYNDLATYKKEGFDHILLNCTFKETFPFEPPFVRVIHPVISGGYVLAGGAICMELLTKHGWSSAYSLESLILQIAATLVKGKARIQFGAAKTQYSLARAHQSFKSLIMIHEKNGWFTPPKEDG